MTSVITIQILFVIYGDDMQHNSLATTRQTVIQFKVVIVDATKAVPNWEKFQSCDEMFCTALNIL